jgi:hypothetical protein
MDIPIKEKRNSLLVIRLTESEMQIVRAFKKSNQLINISHIVREHLLKVIAECTNVQLSEEKSSTGNSKDWIWINPIEVVANK